MKIFYSLLILCIVAFSQTAFAQEGDEMLTPSPEQKPIAGAALPEAVKKMFVAYLPEQKPENCKWTYAEHEKQIEKKKGKKKVSVTVKYKLYSNESPCTLHASDGKSPDVSFIMSGEDDKTPSVSVFSLNAAYLPAGVLQKAKELSTVSGEPQIRADIGLSGKLEKINFSFHQGLDFCTITLNEKGKALEKPQCGRGAYGGM